jgi:hypothetical protein
MVYGRYNELVFMGFINQRSHHWRKKHIVAMFDDIFVLGEMSIYDSP